MTNTDRVVAPSAESLIRELREYHIQVDPKDEYGFGTQEIWKWRLDTFGYMQLFSDWYTSVGSKL